MTVPVLRLDAPLATPDTPVIWSWHIHECVRSRADGEDSLDNQRGYSERCTRTFEVPTGNGGQQ